MNKQDFLKELFSQMKIWEKEELLPEDNIEKIKSYYKSESVLDGTKSNMFITYISVIGAILVGLGFILFFAANWDNISNFFKVALIMVSVITSYFAGFYLVYVKKSHLKTGYAMILLGTIFYGSAIFLLGQIYNLGGTFYQAMLIWLIGVFPLVYITKLRPLLILSFMLFYGFVFGYIDESYRNIDAFDFVVVISSISLFFLAISDYHKFSYIKLGNIYSIVGVLGLYFMFFVLSFEGMWDIYFISDNFPIYIVWIILFITSIFFVYNRFKNKSLDLKIDIGKILVFFVILIYSFLYLDTNILDNGPFALSMILFTNIFYSIMILYLFYLGEKKKIVSYINVATFFLIIFILAKYFDLFYDMMDGALFFIGFGVILITSGYFLERGRKKLLSGLGKEVKKEL